jgi:hypothetical protein
VRATSVPACRLETFAGEGEGGIDGLKDPGGGGGTVWQKTRAGDLCRGRKRGYQRVKSLVREEPSGRRPVPGGHLWVSPSAVFDSE